jgi:hypothetical protein
MDEKIERIALNYQLDIDEIKAHNKYIKDWDHLIPGTKLRLPEISIALNEELDNYEPFIEEYYPKLSNNYENFNDVNVDMVSINNVIKSNNQKNNKVINQSLVLPKNNTYYPYSNYYFGYPYTSYYYSQQNRNKIK